MEKIISSASTACSAKCRKRWGCLSIKSSPPHLDFGKEGGGETVRKSTEIFWTQFCQTSSQANLLKAGIVFCRSASYQSTDHRIIPSLVHCLLLLLIMCHSKIEPETYITSSFILLCSFLHWLIWLCFHIYQKYCVPQDKFATISIKTDHSTSSSSSLHCVVLFPLLIIKAVKRVEVDRGEIATSKSQNLCKLLKRALYWFHRSTISSKLRMIQQAFAIALHLSLPQ